LDARLDHNFSKCQRDLTLAAWSRDVFKPQAYTRAGVLPAVALPLDGRELADEVSAAGE
jgi:hypothetical protein